MKDTTVREVPINFGLDLRGGIHLALEVDQSRGPVPDPAEAIRRAERVVRTRINEFGTKEPVVQIVGGNRLIVELPGEQDPARAKGIIQRTAFLEFRITDMKNQFRDALPGIDQALKAAGVHAAGAAPASAVSQLFGGDTSKQKGKDKAAAKDTSQNQAGALTSLLFQGSVPGEFLVPEEQVRWRRQPPRPARCAAADSPRARLQVEYRGGIPGRAVLSRALHRRRQADHHRRLSREGDGATRPDDESVDRGVHALAQRRPRVRAGDRPARKRLHGHHPGRPRPGGAADHQEPDRAAWPDRAREQDAARRQ